MTRHAVDLALILEDALQGDMATIEHFTVPDPDYAHLWEPLSHLRQRMLRNAFSFLPVWVEREEGWKLVADVELARFLRDVTSRNERMRRLGLSLEQAVKEAIPLRDASCMAPDQTVQDAARSMTDVPVLVVRPHDRRHLLGIATAFDLL